MRRIPNELATLNDLQRNASRFNPFKSVVLFSGGKPKPNPDQYRVARYLQGVGLRHTIEEIGLAATWDMLNGNSGGNAKRVIGRLAEFIPADAEGFQIPNLFQMYRESVSHQVSGGIPPTDSVLERTIVHS